jgi:RHS repeat-associated protein
MKTAAASRRFDHRFWLPLLCVIPWPLASAQVLVTPHGGSATAGANTTGNTVNFTVKNTGTSIETFDLSCSSFGQVTACTSLSQSRVTLKNGLSTTITAFYNTGNGGSGNVTLDATGEINGFSDEGWFNVTVTAPPHLAPGVATAISGDLRDVDRCVINCADNVFTYSTPGYVTMDIERNVTLVYRGSQARPLGTVQLDVTDPSSSPADSVISLKLRRQNGSFVNFTNGAQELFFQPPGTQNGTIRVAGQFDASAQATGDSAYAAIVTSYWHGNVSMATTFNVRVLVVNESSNPVGAGWSLANIQRLYFTDSGFVVVDGLGSASYFRGSCPPNGICTFTSPAGDFSVLSTSGGSYKRHYPDGTDYNFAGNGFPTSVYDRFGNVTNIFTDGSGKVTAILDPAGSATLTQLNYDPNSGKLSSITSPGGRIVTVTVDASGDLRSIVDTVGTFALQADYETGTHRLTHVLDRAGGNWNYAYAVDGTVSSIQAPTITANGNSSRPTTTVSGPSTRIFVAISGGAGTAGNPVARGIDLRATMTNPRGYATNYTVNRFGSPTIITDALGRSATFGYDATTGQFTNGIAVSGRHTTYSWDGPRLIQVIDGPRTVHMEYETVFNQLTHIYGDVAEEWRTYDTNQGSRPLLTSRIAGQGPSTYSFDSQGRLLTISDTLGHVTTWYHGSVGAGLANTDSVSEPGLIATSFSRDGYGRVVATRHPDGSVDSTYYDFLNRVTATVDGRRNRTSFGYDALYLHTVIDARNQQYIYTTNALGWVEQETRPGSSVTIRNSYDLNGNVLSMTNRRGGVVTNAFDPLDRDTLQTADGLTTRWTYGPIDQFVTVSNPESRDSLVMDSYGRIFQINTTRSTSTYAITTGLTNEDRILGYSATSNRWSGTRGPSFTYDSTKHVRTLSSFAGLSTVTWNRDGLPTQLQFPSGMTSTSTFTSAHEEASKRYSNASPGVFLLRDSLGRITQRAPDNFEDASIFLYNQDGSLATWEVAPQGGNCSSFTSSYGYQCWLGLPTQTINYSYDPVGNLTSGGASYTANRLLAANGYTMTYDEDGNLQTKNGSGFSQSLTWNSLGQLTSITTNGTTVSFGYDGLGRRVRKTVNGGATTGYLYAGNDVFMDLDSGGNPVTEYAYWPGIDEPHAMSRGGQTYYFTQDPAGKNISSLVRASDNSVQARYDYTPFGTLRSGSFDNVGNSLQFAARQYDSETGMSYFRARYYDPQMGRFLSEDPIGLAGGINPYSYAANDPINGSDPSGLTECVTIHYPEARVSVGGVVTVYEAYDKTVCVDDGGGGGGGGGSGGGGNGGGSVGGSGGVAGPSDEPKAHSETRHPFFGACNANLAATTAGSAASGNEFGSVRPGQWRGTNGKWYPNSFNGNQYTGGRNAIVEAGETAGKMARGLLVVSVVMSTYQGIEAYREGDRTEAALDAVDIVAAGVGTFGGPIGLAVSVGWFGYRYLTSCGG